MRGDYALIAFGGAGPTQALHLAEEAGIAHVIIPAAPSTFCALGAILADVKRDFVASRFLRLGRRTDCAGRTGAPV